MQSVQLEEFILNVYSRKLIIYTLNLFYFAGKNFNYVLVIAVSTFVLHSGQSVHRRSHSSIHPEW
jgi:hypothetical protein